MTDNVKRDRLRRWRIAEIAAEAAQEPFIEVAREIREIAKWGEDNGSIIDSEIRDLRAAADKLEQAVLALAAFNEEGQA